ncbi:MAG: LamG domain-containing protein, partial [Akkermansiaceae bacterium]|nr:LamG domain-containing protein [Akkermansiaceae bacterium]
MKNYALAVTRVRTLALVLAAGSFATLTLPAEPRIGVHYQLNGSALEARGLGQGTLTGFGADPFVSGQVGPKALRFSSLGQSVALPSFYTGSDYPAVSVSAWINTSVGTDQVIASYDRDQFWRLGIDGASAGPGQVGFAVQTNDGVKDLASVSTVNDGQWHHVLAVFDGNAEKMEIFIDGVSDSSAAVPGAKTFGTGVKRYGYLGVGSKAAAMGGPTGPKNYFQGDLD